MNKPHGDDDNRQTHWSAKAFDSLVPACQSDEYEMKGETSSIVVVIEGIELAI